MMSPYDSLVNETRRIRKGSLAGQLAYLYEKKVLQSSQLVLTDTPLNQRYFCEMFGIPFDKTLALPVGADERVFTRIVARNTRKDNQFSVLFYGSFLPLHGVDIILECAKLLRDLPIHFTLIGGVRTDLAPLRATIDRFRLRNVSHLPWVEYEKLPEQINRADLCLGGPFGNTGQARRVVTGKTFQFLASGKPTVVGEIDWDYGFVDKVNCLLVAQGNPPALADAISWAYAHWEELDEIGERGRKLYLRSFSIDRIASSIRNIFTE
jgi:glycosyltransferase involved in cell wall biosynthesis